MTPHTDPKYPGLPAYFFGWSALAQLTPFLEQTNVYNTMDLTWPLYLPQGSGFIVSPPNLGKTTHPEMMVHFGEDAAIAEKTNFPASDGQSSTILFLSANIRVNPWREVYLPATFTGR